MTNEIANDAALNLIFRDARTYNAWQDRDVSRALIQAIYDLAKMGPTSANSCPARFVFVQTVAGKKRLEPFLSGNNRAKTMAAPVCVIIAHDMEFYKHLPKLFPHTDAKAWFEGNDALIAETALRNASLQGAYFIMAARALGLDCGPMSGFDQAGVNKEFFDGTSWRANFLCNLGYGANENLYPRNLRLDFEEACEIL
ncbi:MAG: malonic semialdehyde reductase [Parvularculaceae bacterium]